MLCLCQWIKRCWPSAGAEPWIWAIPTTHTQVEAGPDTRRDPPPRPKHCLTCGHHAVHRVLRCMGLSPPLKYPLSTTEKEVHQIRTRIWEILAAAAKDGKLVPQNSRPTRDHTSALLQADTYTDMPHVNPAPHPLPLPPPSPSSGPHTPTNLQSPGPRETGLSPPARTLTHARHRPPR